MDEQLRNNVLGIRCGPQHDCKINKFRTRPLVTIDMASSCWDGYTLRVCATDGAECQMELDFDKPDRMAENLHNLASWLAKSGMGRGEIVGGEIPYRESCGNKKTQTPNVAPKPFKPADVIAEPEKSVEKENVEMHRELRRMLGL